MTDPNKGPIDRGRPGAPMEGVTLGRYRIIRFIGAGGMGEVYLADDTLLRRQVALKRLRKAESGPPHENPASILREARRAGRLSDPRIASVYDVVEHEDEAYLVMEYVEGETLRRHMSGGISYGQFLDIAIQCAEAIRSAHRSGVIHRDLKPENIMITRSGLVKLLDFGIARRTGSDDGAESAATLVESEGTAGTPSYMAPEAHLGETLDDRTDIFSLGVVFYEMLTSLRPFRGNTPAARVDQILHHDPEPVRLLRPEVPVTTSDLVTQMLAKNPQDRPQSATQILNTLHTARQTEETDPETPLRRPRPMKRSLPRWTLPVVAASLLVAVVVAVLSGGLTSLGINSDYARLPTPTHVALLPIETPDAEPSFEDFALGLTDALTQSLSGLTTDRRLQVAHLVEVLDHRVTNPRKAGELLGVNLVISTRLERNEHRYRATMSLRIPSTERPLREETISADAHDPARLIDELSHRMAGMMDLAQTDSVDSLDLGSRGAGTLQFFLQGVGRFRRAENEASIRESIDLFELAAKTDPVMARTRDYLARCYLRLYDLTNEMSWLVLSESASREALALDETLARAHRTLAFARYASADHEEALTELRRALALDPTDDWAWQERGRIYGRRGDLNDEERIYREAIDARPHYWRLHWWLGTHYYSRGRFDQALEAFEKMVACAPDLYRCHSNLGALYVLTGKYPEAIEALGRSIELRPTEVAFSNLASALFNTRRFDEAIATYQQAIQTGFANCIIWVNLGDAYYFAPGKSDLAEQAYRQAIHLGTKELARRPYDLTILANLAHVFPKVAELDSARVYIERALVSDPDNPTVFYCAALTFWQLGEKDIALDWLERALKSGYPESWIIDSAMFDEWRSTARFRGMVDMATEET